MRAPGRDRTDEAWCAWLDALASDADAAVAASMAYSALDAAGRDAWLDALDADVGKVHVPPIALYAPLYGVEQDPVRRARIAPMVESACVGGRARRAWWAGDDSARVCALATPLYLSFCEVLVFRYAPDRGVDLAVHEPFRHLRDVPDLVAGAAVAEVAVDVVVDELAHAIVAHGRTGRALPVGLAPLVDLLSVGRGAWSEVA